MTIDCSAPLIYGYGAVGRAMADALASRGFDNIVVVDDQPQQAGTSAPGITVVEPDVPVGLAQRVAASSVVLPSPGLGDDHRVLHLAREHGVPIRSEFDLAQQWDDRPLIVITGTNGKTTVTEMVTHILNQCGDVALAVGNTDLPLVSAIERADVTWFVVEASSFRLAHTHRIEPRVAVWLNLAPDHLDAHHSMESYVAAKASLFSNLAGHPAVLNADDPTVMDNVPPGIDRVLFGQGQPWQVVDGKLWGPDGPIIDGQQLARHRAHDLANALAAVATVAQLGFDPRVAAETLRTFVGLPHRLEPVATIRGVSWFNDSKATVPAATLAAVDGFESVVLIAGGRNKGLDLGPLAQAVPPVRSVVAMGEAAHEIQDAFVPTGVPVAVVSDLAQAVVAAASHAVPGDTVMLSPGCTSFDQFANYGERGDAFRAAVAALKDYDADPAPSPYPQETDR